MSRAFHVRCCLMLAAVALLAMGGCGDTRHTIRSIDQHPGGEFNTMETADKHVVEFGPLYQDTEYVGATYWSCRHFEGRLACERVCGQRPEDSRICAPELQHEFGEISSPGAGVAVARERDPDPDSDPVPESDPESDPDPVPESDPDSVPESEPESDPESEPESDPESEPDSDSDSDSESESGPERESDSESETESDDSSEAESGGE